MQLFGDWYRGVSRLPRAVQLSATAVPSLAQAPIMAFYVGLGLAVLCLGLGFSHAVNTLRLMLYRSKVLSDS